MDSGSNLVYVIFMLLLSDTLYGQSTDGGRKRLLRTLLFPRGSSLQLVYCFTVPTVDMPHIFVVGVTGSLAWELPYNPNEPYRKRAELLHRRIDKPSSGKRITQDIRFRPSDNRNSFYTGSTAIKYPANATYGQWHHGYPIGKYVQANNLLRNKLRWQSHRNKMKYLYYRRVYPGDGYNIYDYSRSDYDHPIYNEFHRRTRRDLYGRLEKLLDSLRLNGKECVLKMLCRFSKVRDGGGSFMEEVMKRIFRNKRSYYGPDPDKYDKAANSDHDCENMHPGCQNL